jgi:hypothetical protein
MMEEIGNDLVMIKIDGTHQICLQYIVNIDYNIAPHYDRMWASDYNDAWVNITFESGHIITIKYLSPAEAHILHHDTAGEWGYVTVMYLDKLASIINQIKEYLEGVRA